LADPGQPGDGLDDDFFLRLAALRADAAAPGVRGGDVRADVGLRRRGVPDHWTLVADEPATPLRGEDESFALQLLERAADGEPAGPVCLAQLRLGRQALPRMQSADLLAQFVGDVLIEGWGGHDAPCWLFVLYGQQCKSMPSCGRHDSTVRYCLYGQAGPAVRSTRCGDRPIRGYARSPHRSQRHGTEQRKPPHARRKVAGHGRARRNEGDPEHAPPPALVAVALRGMWRALSVRPLVARAGRVRPDRRPRGRRVVPEVLREAGPGRGRDRG